MISCPSGDWSRLSSPSSFLFWPWVCVTRRAAMASLKSPPSGIMFEPAISIIPAPSIVNLSEEWWKTKEGKIDGEKRKEMEIIIWFLFEKKKKKLFRAEGGKNAEAEAVGYIEEGRKRRRFIHICNVAALGLMTEWLTWSYRALTPTHTKALSLSLSMTGAFSSWCQREGISSPPGDELVARLWKRKGKNEKKKKMRFLGNRGLFGWVTERFVRSFRLIGRARWCELSWYKPSYPLHFIKAWDM